MRPALGYTPFIDPLPLHEWWYLLIIPLALLIAIAYKAVRVHTLRTYWAEVGVFTVKVVAGVAVLGMAAHVFVRVVLPLVGP